MPSHPTVVVTSGRWFASASTTLSRVPGPDPDRHDRHVGTVQLDRQVVHRADQVDAVDGRGPSRPARRHGRPPAHGRRAPSVGHAAAPPARTTRPPRSWARSRAHRRRTSSGASPRRAVRSVRHVGRRARAVADHDGVRAPRPPHVQLAAHHDVVHLRRALRAGSGPSAARRPGRTPATPPTGRPCGPAPPRLRPERTAAAWSDAAAAPGAPGCRSRRSPPAASAPSARVAAARSTTSCSGHQVSTCEYQTRSTGRAADHPPTQLRRHRRPVGAEHAPGQPPRTQVGNQSRGRRRRRPAPPIASTTPVGRPSSACSMPSGRRSSATTSTLPARPRPAIRWCSRCRYPSTAGHGYCSATTRILTAWHRTRSRAPHRGRPPGPEPGVPRAAHPHRTRRAASPCSPWTTRSAATRSNLELCGELAGDHGRSSRPTTGWARWWSPAPRRRSAPAPT